MKNITDIAGAPQYMRKKGMETDKIVLDEVKNKSGLGIREIANKLKWTNGRVDGSINRLLQQNKVRVRHFLKRGVLVKKVYPIDYVLSPHEEFIIPRELVDDDLWKKNVFAYAISRSTIGLSPIPSVEWKKTSLIHEEAEVLFEKDVLHLNLPESIVDFYNLDNSETSLSLIGNSAIISVEATVIPIDLPQEYPVTTPLFNQYLRLDWTMIKQTPTTATYQRFVITSKGDTDMKVEFDKDMNINVVGVPSFVDQSDTSGAKIIEKPIEMT